MTFRTILHQLRSSNVYKLMTGEQLQSSQLKSAPCLTENVISNVPKKSSLNSPLSQNATSKMAGLNSNGTPSVVSAELSRSAVMLAASVSVQDLNAKCSPTQLTDTVRIEHRELVKVLKSMSVNCARDGHSHYDTILRPDVYVRRLIKEGILPQDAEMGRVQVGSYKRTGVCSTVGYLKRREVQIKNFMEDDGCPRVDEMYNILLQGVMLAYLTGAASPESHVIAELAQLLYLLPSNLQGRVLNDTDVMMRLGSRN